MPELPSIPFKDVHCGVLPAHHFHRRYKAEIFLKRRKTLSNQSITTFSEINVFSDERLKHESHFMLLNLKVICSGSEKAAM